MYRLPSLLFILLLAPACAPEHEVLQSKKAPPEKERPLPTVLLTDAEAWTETKLDALKDSLESTGHRVVISGYPNETAAQLAARLPWLLQPGTALIVYDPALAGVAGMDSLRAVIKRLDRNIPVEILTHGQE